jgi:hypothetical protein
LKELFLSSMMRWIAAEQQDSTLENMQQVMEKQVDILHEQMVSASKSETEIPVEQVSPGIQEFMMGRRFITRG